MATPKGQGWYLWEDGTYYWVHGMSAQERRREELKHGRLIKYSRV